MGLKGERRKNFRLPVQIPVHHRIPGRDFEDSLTLDIHKNGAFILSEVLPDIGTPVTLDFAIPDTGQLVRVGGEVRWIIGRQSNHEPGMGIKFEKPVKLAIPIELLSRHMDDKQAIFTDYARYLFYPEIQRLKNINDHVIGSVDNGVIILDREFIVRNYNPRQCATLIPEEQKVIGRTVWEVNDLFNMKYQEKRFRDILQGVLAGKSYKITNVQYEPYLKENDFKDTFNDYRLNLELKPVVEANGAINNIIIIIQDVSKERRWILREKELESALLEQSGYYSVGLMVDGLLNNMVNPLSAIMGRLELLNLKMQALRDNLTDSYGEKAKTDEVDKYIKELKMISHDVRILSDLCRNLMNRINKERDSMPSFINLNDLIMDEIVYQEKNLRFKYKISKKLSLAKDLPYIWGVYSDFSQIIFTILNNCIEAMYLSDKKELFISTRAEGNIICLDIRHSGTNLYKISQKTGILNILNILKKKYNFDLSVQEQSSNITFSLRIQASEN